MSAAETLSAALLSAFRKPDYLRSLYPVLFTPGIYEGSLHSYMLSVLLALGSHMGFMPVCDSPVFDRFDNMLTGEGNKRPDSVWYQFGTEKIDVLIEFERYKPNALEHKARNLLLMNSACPVSPQLLALFYWSYDVLSSTTLNGPISVFCNGCSINGNVFNPAACPVLIIEIIVSSQNGKTRIETAIARSYIHNGEPKKYMVDLLNT